MKRFIPLLIPISVAMYLLWLFGFIVARISVDKHPYWPDMGYGRVFIFIHKNGGVIYLDDFNWNPSNYDTLFKSAFAIR
jgi:hypothetical protein